MQTNRMKNLVKWIKEELSLTSIPVRVKNEKRWESMDEIIEREPFEGVPHRIDFRDGYGVIIYSWDEISNEIDKKIVEYYNSNN